MSTLKCYSLIVAVLVCEILRDLFYLDFTIKWPNDIYFNNKKLGGILVEVSGDPDSEIYVVVGIGLNVDMSFSDCGLVDQPFTDLSTATGAPVDRHPLIIRIVEALLPTRYGFSEKAISNYLYKWGQYDFLIGKQVSASFANNTVVGEAVGVSPDGELLVKQKDGLVISLGGGEVSVRSSDQKSGVYYDS